MSLSGIDNGLSGTSPSTFLRVIHAGERPAVFNKKGFPRQDEFSANISPFPTMRDFLLSPETGKRGDGTVRLWEVRTGKERRVLKGHRGTVRCLAISPDGKFLVSGGHDKSVIAWDPSTGKMLWKSNRLTGPGADRIGVATFRTG